MEPRLHQRLQEHRRHGLRNAILNCWHTKRSGTPAMRLRYHHRPHRRRKVRPRAHPIPDLVQVVLQILLEFLDRDTIHSRCALVGFHLPVCLPYLLLRDVERLALYYSRGFTLSGRQHRICSRWSRAPGYEE